LSNLQPGPLRLVDSVDKSSAGSKVSIYHPSSHFLITFQLILHSAVCLHNIHQNKEPFLLFVFKAFHKAHPEDSEMMSSHFNISSTSKHQAGSNTFETKSFEFKGL